MVGKNVSEPYVIGAVQVETFLSINKFRGFEIKKVVDVDMWHENAFLKLQVLFF